ncbi:hypothetical protein [Winogradskyella haliclonae]|uniref:Uncharacterized protein n=1 Tax=Winogradskyella haliclonae TaxID=2048558 RepID=A0ABQ2BWZ9_9FLAO|nr:hypothetical protein [Winogradskyella haliclonae]GGI57002.1 hypothetical protein GCM10011444_13110 [Winogradskyella haliclonae]
MKKLKTLTLLFTISASMFAYSQSGKALMEKVNERKVDTAYTWQESANMHFQFYKDTKKMKLSDEVENSYTNIIFNSTAKMARLDDKDKDYTAKERKTIFLKMVDDMNGKIKAILTKEQYAMHVTNFNRILRSVYRRSGWVWEE